MDQLDDLHGPILLINGGEVDFMYETARENFEAVDHIPVFYGARENAGHSATYPHPGGGEFANVISDWLMYQFKGDQDAARQIAAKQANRRTDRSELERIAEQARQQPIPIGKRMPKGFEHQGRLQLSNLETW